MVFLVHFLQSYILDLSWRHYSLEEEEGTGQLLGKVYTGWMVVGAYRKCTCLL